MNRRIRRESRPVIFKKNPEPPQPVNITGDGVPVYDEPEAMRAVVMTLVGKYRGDPSTHKNLVAEFVAAVELEAARYAAKGLEPTIAAEVQAIAQRAIARARRQGVTAFEAE
jgi:hypothetical protein